MSYLKEILRLALCILGMACIVWVAGHLIQAWVMWVMK